MSLLFYDFEVFRHNWLVVFIEPHKREKRVIIDNPEELSAFYDEHKQDIWVGYNNKAYDQYIAKGILCGFNPYEVNNWIIRKGRAGWQFSSLFRQFPILNFDIATGFHSLKQLEGFLGNDIRESNVSFNLDRPLTEEEIQETVRYCTHDVEQTIEVFMHRYEMFEAQMALIKAFDLPISCISKTQTQLAGVILGATPQHYNDEFDVLIPPTLRLSEKYQHIVDFFVNAKEDTLQEMKKETEHLIQEEQEGFIDTPKKHKQWKEKLAEADWNDPEAFSKWFYSRKLDVEVSGVPHTFAWGGVHGAISQYVGEGRFIMADVASLYPSLMIRYNYFSRSVSDPQKYVRIYETNLEMKKTKDPLRPAYKLVCNKTYGALKDRNNPLFDPQMANNICVAGQLLLLDLMEKLEGCCDLIQSNTDGILIQVKDYEQATQIIKEWEERTGLIMEFSEFVKVYQGDVNNYLILDAAGKYKSKGAYVKELNPIDYDMPIVNQAITEYLVNGTHPRETIMSCNDMKEFQKIVKISSKFNYASIGAKSKKFAKKDLYFLKTYPEQVNDECMGTPVDGKTFRVFASTRYEDGAICKNDSSRVAKFGNTPTKCFVYNGSVNETPCPPHLDKNYYVWLAIDRIHEKFGVTICDTE